MQRHPTGSRPLGVDAVGAIDQVEQVGVLSHRLRRAEDEEPGSLQRVVEHRQHLLLQGRRHVDEHVAATDQVHLRERRIGRDVLAREDAQVADRLLDPIDVVLLAEEASQPLRRELGLDRLRVDARPRLVERGRVRQVGGEDLHLAPLLLLVEELEQRHRDRVGLLTRGAARYPYPHRQLGGLRAQDVGKDALLEQAEQLGVAEEAGDRDQHVAVQVLGLGAILSQEIGVPLEAAGHPVEGHAASDAALDGGVAVQLEVDTGDAAHRSQDAAELLVIVLELEVGSGEVGVTADLGEPLGDLVRRQDEVDAAAVDRAAGHAGVAGRTLVLREGDPARGLDLGDPQSSVRPAPRQHDGDRAGPLLLGQRTKEVVDREMRRPGVSARRDDQATLLDREVAVGRDDVGVVAADHEAVGRLQHRHLRRSRQQLTELAGVVRVEVLDQDEGESGPLGDAVEELRERFEPSRGSADADDGEGGFRAASLLVGRRGTWLRRGHLACARTKVGAQLVTVARIDGRGNRPKPGMNLSSVTRQ